MKTIKKLGFSFLLMLLALTFIANPVFADKYIGEESTAKTNRTKGDIGSCSVGIAERYLDANNVRARILNTGGLFWNGDPHIYEVPIDGGVMSIFAGGVWIGGRVDGELRVAGARYGAWEFWPGPLDANGNPPADCSDYDRIYKVNRSDIDNYLQSGTATKDLAEWPYELGAPVVDGDGNPNNYDLAAGDLPKMEGDQMLWWVMNDMGNTHNHSQTDPIGLEVQVTAFAFIQAGDIGNMTFYKYKIIYKGDAPLTDTYMAIWSDPDLGEFDDDYVGSDTSLGVGYVWNGEDVDGQFGIPPSMGYDFFLGPITDVDNDGVLDTLGMTNFTYFNNSGQSNCSDPGNGVQVYYSMQTRCKDGTQLTEGLDGQDPTRPPTKFAYPGEPGEYWSEENTDGQGTRNPPADRRFVMSSGPFVMNPGDTQNITYGVVWARGSDRFDSVAKMKFADAKAQALFDANFQTAPAPKAPTVSINTVDGDAYITWTNTQCVIGQPRNGCNYLDTYNEIDPLLPDLPGLSLDYDLEGYIVWQFSDVSDQDGKILAVYDKVNGLKKIYDNGADPSTVELVVSGNDTGIQNWHQLGGLRNYTTYNFGVQAYAYNEDSVPKVLFGPITRLEYIPTKITNNDGGTVVNSELGDVITSTIVAGQTDGSVTAKVVDPAAVTGDEYQISFVTVEIPGTANTKALDESGEIDALTPAELAKNKKAETTIAYTITNVTTGEVVFDGEKAVQATGQELPYGTPVAVIDGLEFTVNGAPFAWKDFQVVANAGGPLASPEGAGADWYSFPGLGRPGSGQQVGEGAWLFHTGDNGGTSCGGSRYSYSSFLSRSMRSGFDHVVPYDWEMRFTSAGGLSYRRFEDGAIVPVPFELWRVGVGTYDDPSDDVRLIPGMLTLAGAGVGGDDPDAYDMGRGDCVNDHSVSGADNDPYTDWIYWGLPDDETPGQSGYDNFFTGNASWAAEIIARSVLVNWNGGDVTAGVYDQELPETGTVFRLVSTKPNVPGVVHSINTAEYGIETGTVASADMLDLIGVTPNPYKGTSQYEVTTIKDEVRFTNLPERATIRVYTLSGTLVNTIEKSGPENYLKWDLSNHNGLRIASGMYLVHVDVPGVGEKVIKFGVVRRKVQLETF